MNIKTLTIKDLMLVIIIIALILWFFVVVRPWWIESQGMRLIG